MLAKGHGGRRVLDRIVARVERLPVLLIATFRPEFQPPWIGQPYVTTVMLNRLSRDDGAALVRQLIGNEAKLPAEVIDGILDRTDGVPLFLEEVTKGVSSHSTFLPFAFARDCRNGSLSPLW